MKRQHKLHLSLLISNNKTKLLDILAFATMAVPIFQEEEQEQENNSVVGEEEENNNNNNSESSSTSSFLGQLVTELVGVYRRYCDIMGDPQPSVGVVNNQRMRRNNRSASSRANTNQQTPSNNHNLPDLVCCHMAANNMPQFDQENYDQEIHHDQELHHQQLPPLPMPMPPNRTMTTNNAMTTTDTFGLSLDIKMEIDFSYRRIGRELRTIADTYQENNRGRQQRRRRHPAGGNRNRTPEESTLKFQFALKVVIPVTFVGLSLALLRKSC